MLAAPSPRLKAAAGQLSRGGAHNVPLLVKRHSSGGACARLDRPAPRRVPMQPAPQLPRSGSRADEHTGPLTGGLESRASVPRRALRPATAASTPPLRNAQAGAPGAGDGGASASNPKPQPKRRLKRAAAPNGGPDRRPRRGDGAPAAEGPRGGAGGAASMDELIGTAWPLPPATARALARGFPAGDLALASARPLQVLCGTRAAAGAEARAAGGDAVAGRAVPTALSGGPDVVVLGPPGAPRDLSVVVAVVEKLARCPAGRGCVGALIVVPSRERADTVHEAAFTFVTERRSGASGNGMTVVAAHGGTRFRDDVASLRAQPPDLLIATPGRLRELLTSEQVALHQLFADVRLIVLDGADVLAGREFRALVEQLLRLLPTSSLSSSAALRRQPPLRGAAAAGSAAARGSAAGAAGDTGVTAPRAVMLLVASSLPGRAPPDAAQAPTNAASPAADAHGPETLASRGRAPAAYGMGGAVGRSVTPPPARPLPPPPPKQHLQQQQQQRQQQLPPNLADFASLALRPGYVTVDATPALVPSGLGSSDPGKTLADAVATALQPRAREGTSCSSDASLGTPDTAAAAGAARTGGGAPLLGPPLLVCAAPLEEQAAWLYLLVRVHVLAEGAHKVLVLFPSAALARMYARLFQALGFPVAEAHARTAQSPRQSAVRDFAAGQRGILFATQDCVGQVRCLTLVVWAGRPRVLESLLHMQAALHVEAASAALSGAVKAPAAAAPAPAAQNGAARPAASAAAGAAAAAASSSAACVAQGAHSGAAPVTSVLLLSDVEQPSAVAASAAAALAAVGLGRVQPLPTGAATGEALAAAQARIAAALARKVPREMKQAGVEGLLGHLWAVYGPQGTATAAPAASIAGAASRSSGPVPAAGPSGGGGGRWKAAELGGVAQRFVRFLGMEQPPLLRQAAASRMGLQHVPGVKLVTSYPPPEADAWLVRPAQAPGAPRQ